MYLLEIKIFIIFLYECIILIQVDINFVTDFDKSQ